jgi:isopenicillin N synthase-like dioxygenase
VEAVDVLNPGDIARQFSQQSDTEPNKEEEEEEGKVVPFLVEKNHLGLERRPDCIFVIDTAKANLECVQSSERDNSIHVLGKIPAAALVGVEPNEPVNLPDYLRASIVDPKSFKDIPIIDLQTDEATLVEQMKHACEVVGFMQVTGHGVSTELQARHMDLQRKFFALPAAIKERLRLNAESPVRGYFGVGGEDLDQVLERQVDEANGTDSIKKSRKDYKEALDMNGVPWSKPEGGYVAEIFGLPSRMPEEEELKCFREVLNEYATEMFRIAQRVLEIMALVLDKPKNFFESYLTRPVATHRLLHYWPLKDLTTQIGVGEHTDYGLLTLLKQDMVGGLQVLNARDGKWIHCPPIDNAFVVNLGDMLSRWTGHRFKSTVHRVVTTSSTDRYSVPYFLEPNMDTVISYGGLCHGPGMQNSSDGSSLKFQPPPRQPESLFKEDTAEAILGRFYTASGQLASSKVRGFSQQVGSANDGGGEASS